jgi:hypothetical protein
MGSKNDLYRLMYVSDQREDAACDMGNLMEDAKLYNRKCGVTGALWYDGERFLQLLEGDKDALNQVFKRIAKSRYHQDIDVLCFSEVEDRIYRDWAMSYFGSSSHNREVAEEFAGGSDLCLRSMPTQTLVKMLSFLEAERQSDIARSVG